MIKYTISSKENMDVLMQIRLEMLHEVNRLPDDFVFDNELIKSSREYFENESQTTILAFDEESAIGCATICYIEIMPTFSHPTGKRAHLMNVYTNSKYRRQGIALNMVNMLIEEARKKGVTEISLDATELGKPLYKSCGFVESEECMVLNLN